MDTKFKFSNSLTETKVTQLPRCSFADSDNGAPGIIPCGADAAYDGKTRLGPWAYMCEPHFAQVGIGVGTGVGQRLVVEIKPRRPRVKYLPDLTVGGVMEFAAQQNGRPCACEDYPCCGH